MMHLLSILYSLVLFSVALAFLPRFLYERFRYGKYKENFCLRFGTGFESVKKSRKKLIWVHAISVGEVKACIALCRKLKEETGCVLLVTTITETGMAEAKRSLPADYFFYLPFDFSWIMRKVFSAVRPDLILLVESDFWFNFLREAKKCKTPVILVNGKMSERSAGRFKLFSWFSARLFDSIDLFCVQGTTYADRFHAIGIPSNKIAITGNMKFDMPYPKKTKEELDALRAHLGISQEDQVVVFASTHAPEEALCLPSIKKLLARAHPVKVLIVPRHPERFNKVASLLEEQQIAYGRYSEPNLKGDCLLIDAMGVLLACYQIADLAVVGGSFTDRVGGHNLFEPAAYGVPVLFGPHMFSQPDMTATVLEEKAGIQLDIKDLYSVLSSILDKKETSEAISSAAIKMTKDAQGATQRTFDEITRFF